MKCPECRKKTEEIIDYDYEGNALECYYCSQCKKIFHPDRPKINKIFIFQKGAK
jgi:hypothetical protein